MTKSNSTSRFRARTAGAVLATTGLLTCALVAANPATADTSDPYIASNSGGANLRASADTGSYSEEYLPNGTSVVMICYLDAQTVSPPASNYASARWFKVEPTYDPNVGYVHSSLVTHQSTVPPC